MEPVRPSRAGLTRARAALDLSKVPDFQPKVASSKLVSRPAGFHRQPLAEPDVRLSLHPAPIKHDPFAYRIASLVHEELGSFSVQFFEEEPSTGLDYAL